LPDPLHFPWKGSGETRRAKKLGAAMVLGQFDRFSHVTLGGTPMRKQIIPFQKDTPPTGENWLNLNHLAQLRLA